MWKTMKSCVYSGWVNVAALQPATCRWVTLVLFNLPLVTWTRILRLLDKKIMLHNLSGYKIILINVQTRMSPYQQKKVPIFCSHVPMIPCSSDVSWCSHNVHIYVLIFFHYFTSLFPCSYWVPMLFPHSCFTEWLIKHHYNLLVNLGSALLCTTNDDFFSYYVPIWSSIIHPYLCQCQI
jgi:hypothetical protein